MPFTPFHFGQGAALYAMAPRQLSFLAFCAANVLIDVEPLYYMLTDQYPWHRFFHTYVGATLMLAATVGLFILARWLTGWVSVPNWFTWQELTVRQVTIGAAAGSYSHIVLDSIMHPDIQPLFPISRSNTLLQIMDVDTLQVACLVAGLVAIVLLGVRHLLRA
jgi:membrane-bound metal-dependent hydrolase YbcI (DUF457 family)